MSSPLTRMLLKLYPRWVRDRYGDELLDLQDELRARGEISRLGVWRDAIGGALLVRSVRQRTQLAVALATAIAVLVLAGLALSGVTVSGRTAPARAGGPAPSHRVQIAMATVPALPDHSCFVDAGTSCSAAACTELVAQPAVEGARIRGTRASGERRVRAVCTTSHAEHSYALPVRR